MKKVSKVECYCGKVKTPNRDGIVRCFDCGLTLNINVFNQGRSDK
jgi:hypothetical protein